MQAMLSSTLRRTASSKDALHGHDSPGAAGPRHAADVEAAAELAFQQDRLRRCHYCAAYINQAAELYLLDDAIYCCASHRARAAAVGKAVAAGWEPQEQQRSAFARRLPTSTGVGLAASHRSWFELADLGAPGTCPQSESDSSITTAVSEQSDGRSVS